MEVGKEKKEGEKLMTSFKLLNAAVVVTKFKHFMQARELQVFLFFFKLVSIIGILSYVIRKVPMLQ